MSLKKKKQQQCFGPKLKQKKNNILTNIIFYNGKSHLQEELVKDLKQKVKAIACPYHPHPQTHTPLTAFPQRCCDTASSPK